MKVVLDYLAEYDEMTDEDLQELLNVKKTRAYLLARQMNENGLIDIVGRGATRWSLLTVSGAECFYEWDCCFLCSIHCMTPLSSNNVTRSVCPLPWPRHRYTYPSLHQISRT